MDKFWKLDETRVWDKGDSCIYAGSNRIGCHSSFNSEGWEPCTREEFTAAALQVIEMLKAQGIDIGTDWLPKWEPKIGEVVCAWDNSRGDGYVVGRFTGKDDGIFPYRVGDSFAYQYIAPFTGEIPEPFKTRWGAESNGPA
jgi:hypothetical protein